MKSDYRTDACVEGTIMALGNFDGIHLGHRVIIAETSRQARARGCKSSVLLLNPHPMQFFNKARGPFLLNTIGDKRAMFKELGIDCVFIEEFDSRLASLEPEAFVRDCLVGKYRIRGAVVGFDYTFGSRGAGKTRHLEELGNTWGFSVTVKDTVSLEDQVVSSTLIRSKISRGLVAEAALFLGYPYYIHGRVIPGTRLGRTLGFPTANLQVDPDIMRPGKGVYLSSARLRGAEYHALTNVGFKPTVSGQNLSLEVHLLHFSGDIYGEEMTVSFLQRLRDEKFFKDTEELKAQILQDIRRGEGLIREKFGPGKI